MSKIKLDLFGDLADARVFFENATVPLLLNFEHALVMGSAELYQGEDGFMYAALNFQDAENQRQYNIFRYSVGGHGEIKDGKITSFKILTIGVHG